MKPVVYHHAAEREFLHAYAGRRHIGGTRRLMLTRFPYSLIYLIQVDRCYVVAFAHAKRRPGYWRERVN